MNRLAAAAADFILASFDEEATPLPGVEWAELTRTLASLEDRLDGDERRTDWFEPLHDAMKRAGVWTWAASRSLPRGEMLARYARLAQGSLTAALILTQHDAAVRRLIQAVDSESSGKAVASEWLKQIVAGEAFPTAGLSQLTTSTRRGTCAVTARAEPDGGWRIDGIIPWVTAASRADLIVVGAVTEENQQILAALPTRREGVRVEEAMNLAALEGTETAEVSCRAVRIDPDEVLIGPVANALAGATGGLETSALALGQSRAAIAALHDLATTQHHGGLDEVATGLAGAWRLLWAGLENLADDSPSAASQAGASAQRAALLRGAANDLALRATQAYLIARRGSGLIRPDPAQRWARQALFFLVWSCPSTVAQTALGHLAACPTEFDSDLPAQL